MTAPPVWMTHSSLSDELAGNIRELGQIRSAITRSRADAWLHHEYLPVTERRETVAAAIAQLSAEAAVLEAECEAQRVELNALEFAHRIKD